MFNIICENLRVMQHIFGGHQRGVGQDKEVISKKGLEEMTQKQNLKEVDEFNKLKCGFPPDV